MAERLEATKNWNRLLQMWKYLQPQYAWALEGYKLHCDPLASGARFMEFLLEKVESMSQVRMLADGIRQFRVELYENDPEKKMREVNALVWGAGVHRKLSLCEDENLPREAKALALRGKVGLGIHQSKNKEFASLYPRYYNALRTLRRCPGFKEALQAWRNNLPGNSKRQANCRFVGYLDELMDAAPPTPSGRDGIDMASVEIPGVSGRIMALRRRDAEGYIVDLRIVAADESELEYALDRMETASEGAKSRTPSKPPLSARWHKASKVLIARLSREFKAYREAKARACKGALPGWGMFTIHLDKLCQEDPNSASLDDMCGIFRHRVKPEGSDHTITLLRYADESTLMFRALKPDSEDEEIKALKSMRSHLRSRRTIQSKQETKSDTAFVAATLQVPVR
jgi:hypothetical protein